MMIADVPEMLTLREAAKRYRLSYDMLRKLCLTGTIVHVKAGNKFLINAGKLTEYLNGGK